MIYLILDVGYFEQNQNTYAIISAIRFAGIQTHTILNQYKTTVHNVMPYKSGQFYQREMPCLLQLINEIKEPFDIIIIDGYVYLDGETQAGLGKHLYEHLNDKKPIIGIAKNSFQNINNQYAIYRGNSKKPLFITCIDFDLDNAKQLVKNLEGQFRIPNIINMVDKINKKQT